ncbi:prenyltransferase [Periweissella cryptocerci]|uniref:Prenyltransferase n=1 Tax=Periweissella cryptocerci TaxID=2506420 RepID=A0A4P6YTF6_9LACO|nr:UbiA family prenyltransferase [Periweissella cryptocerci]QBO35937.1 prenyltransferase [Periweissella cryptocerci]
MAVNRILFVAMLAFHLATNVWDNFQDFLNAKHETFKQGVNNVVGREAVTKQQVGMVLAVLVGIATILGVYLWLQVGGWLWPLLAFISYFVGFFYAGGPKPISRTPLGELFSGVTMGYVILLMVVYLNIGVMTWHWAWQTLLVSGMGVFSIANIMLANNIGDYIEDLAEERHTLVYYLGQSKALIVYLSLYIAGYLTLITTVVLGILPWTVLLALLAWPVIIKSFKFFWHDRTKRGSFLLTIKNTVLIMVLFIVGMIVGLIV